MLLYVYLSIFLIVTLKHDCVSRLSSYCHPPGNYMTFIMNPLLYPSIIKHGRQLDFHEFTNKVVSQIFSYPPVQDSLWEEIRRGFHLLQGDNLTPLTESMMGNLMLVFRQDHLKAGDWRRGNMYDFCSSLMFEATFLTVYGKPATGSRHSWMGSLRDDFNRFDSMFPLLIAQIPIWMLRQTKAIRNKLISSFLPQRLSCWGNTSQFIRRRVELLEQHGALRDVHKAGRKDLFTFMLTHQGGILIWNNLQTPQS